MAHASIVLVAVMSVVPSLAYAQGSTGGQPAPPPSFADEVTVIGTTPLPGVGVTIDQIPSPVQKATAADIEASGALDLSDFLNRRVASVHVNEMQGNPFQADVNYRGYTASPLLGTPQGLSVFMDGVRINQPFGDVVSWDLIPRLAIASSVLMPGSNPLFGLNTLGGALSLHTKDGRSHPGTVVQASYGTHIRRAVEFEHGGAKPAGLSWYLAGHLFGEDGWRGDSPSDVRQLFGKVGWLGTKSDMTIGVSHADNSLTGSGLQEEHSLQRDYATIYTKPDTTDNRSTSLILTARHTTARALMLSGNVYYRRIRSNGFNGDLNEDSLDQSLYQPGPAERAALAAAGYPDVPASGLNADNTPFPFLRCIGNVLIHDEPGEKCNGLINRTETHQHNEGASAQASERHGVHQITMGAAYDHSQVGFVQSTELGYINPDRTITGTGAFADGVSAGTVDGEPFDTRVDLDGAIHTWSLYATDTLTLGAAWHVTVSGRFNRTTVHNVDAIEPGGGPGSLDGDHAFSRFNPAAGVTFNASRGLNVFAGYSEGSRAATSIELGCANADEPCKLPNAMTGDPPLDQVVTRTFDAGVRGGPGGPTSWNASFFRSENHDDILFVTSEHTGFGYFKNFGQTRRQGVELGFSTHRGRATVGSWYTLLAATYRSEETVDGSGNSTNDTAESGLKGLEGSIEIVPGDHMPLVPRHVLKAYGEFQVTPALSVGLNLEAVSSSFARGNENNQHEGDGTYYLSSGSAPAFAVVDLDARFRIKAWLEIFAQLNNLFDRRYYSAAQLGPNGFTDAGTFIARPLPPVNGEFPLVHGTFLAPGAPRSFLVGTRVKL